MSWDAGEDERQELLANRERKLEQLRDGGEYLDPVECQTRSGLPATTFWGKSWCLNLESYSDFKDRMPRGRTYLRKGNVLGLRIDPGEVFAYVTGADLYEVFLQIDPLDGEAWETFKTSCASSVDSLLQLLAGELGDGTLSQITNQETGLFPQPEEIHLSCSCPDYADMCKHVAAVLYGVGVHLDADPELFFRLREIDHRELLEQAAERAQSLAGDSEVADPESLLILKDADLSELFGVEVSNPEAAFGPGS